MNKDFIKPLLMAIAIVVLTVIAPAFILTQCNSDGQPVQTIILPLDGNDYVGQKVIKDYRLVPVYEDQSGLFYRIDFGTGGTYKVRVDVNDERLTL